MTFNGRGIIFYELNEVPKKIFETYIELKPKSTISKIIDRSNLIETFTHDQGELHPWTTWPTLHRGVPNFKHNIRFINQDLNEANAKFPPFWIELVASGIDVGIFGSLQSYPPIRGKNFKFYLPDTFSPNPDSFPNDIKNFQEFNLKLSGQNKAKSGSFDFVSIYLFLKLFCLRIIGINSFFKVLIHVLNVRIYQ